MLKKISLVSLSVLTLCSSSAMASLAGAGGTLKNIDSALNDAVHKSERMFEENHGKYMKSKFKVIDNKKNPYIQVLNVAKDYSVKLKFAGDAKKGQNNSIPVAKALLGTEIMLIPVYNKGDEKITSWECLTNADKEVQEFMGSKGTKEYTASYIREHTKNNYLSLCVYINKNLVGK